MILKILSKQSLCFMFLKMENCFASDKYIFLFYFEEQKIILKK